MPDWKSLKAGDRIRLLRVPGADARQREQELRNGAQLAGWTADTIERIIASNPIVIIDRVDEFGAPWFERELPASDSEIEYHSLTITVDDSWEFVKSG